MHWRDELDAGAKGLDIGNMRYNKPVSVLIDYEDYLAIVEQLEDQRAARRQRARQRKLALGGSGACVSRPPRRRTSLLNLCQLPCQSTH